MDKPLPCPHCGSKAEKRSHHAEKDRFFYCCSQSECNFSYTDEKKAIEAWNKRWIYFPLPNFEAQSMALRYAEQRKLPLNKPQTDKILNGFSTGYEIGFRDSFQVLQSRSFKPHGDQV